MSHRRPSSEIIAIGRMLNFCGFGSPRHSDVEMQGRLRAVARRHNISGPRSRERGQRGRRTIMPAPERRVAERGTYATSIRLPMGRNTNASVAPRDCVSILRHRAAAEEGRTAQGVQTGSRRPGRRAERRESAPLVAAAVAVLNGVPDGANHPLGNAGRGFGAARGMKARACTTRATGLVAPA